MKDNHLARLFVALEGERKIPADTSAWLLNGLREFINGRGKTNLCTCLELRARGRESVGAQLGRAERDRWIAEAFLSVTVDIRSSNWERAKRLAREVNLFESSAWPRLRSSNIEPENGFKRYLFLAFKTGITVPSSPRRLLDIATNHPVFISNKWNNSEHTFNRKGKPG